MNYLLFCADDFGLTPNINQTILELIHDKKLHATSVMPNKAAKSDIISLSGITETKIGLHFYLTTLPWLSEKSIHILAKPKDIYASFFANKKKIIEEFKYQLFFLEDSLGKKVDYIDSHHYIFAFPFIISALLNEIPQLFENRLIKLPNYPDSINLKINNMKIKSLKFLSERVKTKHPQFSYLDGMLGIHGFISDPLAQFEHETALIEDKKETYHFSTHPCSEPKDIIGIDTLTEYRMLDYLFLKNTDFSRYNTTKLTIGQNK